VVVVDRPVGAGDLARRWVEVQVQRQDARRAERPLLERDRVQRAPCPARRVAEGLLQVGGGRIDRRGGEGGRIVGWILARRVAVPPRARRRLERLDQGLPGERRAHVVARE